MADKKKQHYIPKFYMRNFTDNKNSISTLNIETEKYISDASIKNMFQKPNFYGEDKKLETFLDIEIEREASKIIHEIIEKKKIPTDKASKKYQRLITFVVLCEGRNLKSADSYNKFIDYTLKELLRHDPSFDDYNLDKFEIGIDNSPALNVDAILENAPIVMDLEPLLIIYKNKNRKFITSDNSLVRYNSFYLSRNYSDRGYGLISTGLQLFLPISPELCILLYDKNIYNVTVK